MIHWPGLSWLKKEVQFEQRSVLGRTGLHVSRLGLGLGVIQRLPADTLVVDQLLGLAAEHGLNFLDTANVYGHCEELMGKALVGRREKFVIGTKCGRVLEHYGCERWSARAVRVALEESLVRLKTDYLDLLMIHSCDVKQLELHRPYEEMIKARSEGKIRFMGYSGDGDAALWALRSGFFDVLETSFNVADQSAKVALLAEAKRRGIGIIAKRPMANAVWIPGHLPTDYTREYARRFGLMRPYLEEELDPGKALGYVLADARVDVAIVGTRKAEHLLENIEIWKNATISRRLIGKIDRAFQKTCHGCPQLS